MCDNRYTVVMKCVMKDIQMSVIKFIIKDKIKINKIN